MTEEHAIELGKRAVAAGWGWQPGAKTMQAERFVAVYKNGVMVALDGGASVWSEVKDDDTPDFRDPSTLGCLLSQVRERWDDSTIHVQFYEETWRVAYWNPDNFFWAYWPEESFATEVEALVACLEAPK